MRAFFDGSWVMLPLKSCSYLSLVGLAWLLYCFRLLSSVQLFLWLRALNIFLVHYKINHIKAFAVCGAVGRKTKSRLRFVVQLQARGFVVVERTIYALVTVGV